MDFLIVISRLKDVRISLEWWQWRRSLDCFQRVPGGRHPKGYPRHPEDTQRVPAAILSLAARASGTWGLPQTPLGHAILSLTPVKVHVRNTEIWVCFSILL